MNQNHPIKCLWCDEKFSNKIALANHFDNTHKNHPKPDDEFDSLDKIVDHYKMKPHEIPMALKYPEGRQFLTEYNAMIDRMRLKLQSLLDKKVKEAVVAELEKTRDQWAVWLMADDDDRDATTKIQDVVDHFEDRLKELKG